MQLIEAPNPYPVTGKGPDIFLGGGITNCPDWQSEAVSLLEGQEGIILNPRRTGEFTEDIAGEQIEWEYKALRAAQAVFFWFPMETLCPITLLELGVFTQRPQTQIIVGTHPEYARRFDVIKQLELARPEVHVQDNIEGMVQEYLSTVVGKNAEYQTEELVQYERTRTVILEELEPLIDSGTLADLYKAIGDNYDGVKARHVKAVLEDLRQDKLLYVDACGFLLSQSGLTKPR